MTLKSALPVLATLLAASPALADTTYTLDKIVITGLKSVDPNTITIQLKDQPGARVTTDDILADQDQLEKLLEAKHVTGGIKTSLADKHNGHINVMFAVQDKGIVAPTVVTVAPKLKAQVFAGNKKLGADALAAASGLAPGEELSNEKITAAQAAIAAAYKKADVGVNVSGAIAQSGDGVQITWTIVEQGKKKKRKGDSDEGYTLDQ